MKKFLRILLWTLPALALVWLIGDYVHSRVVAHRVAQREATIERDAGGVEVGCNAFTRGDGPTAFLLVHGINSSPRCFDNLAQTLAEAGHNARAMRLPGFAETLDKYAQATNRQWQESLGKELAALRAEHEQVVIVAHSLGGAVAIGHLLDHPTAADKLVLLAPAVAVSNHRSPLLSTRAWHELAKRLLLFSDTTWSPFGIDCRDPSVTGYPGHCASTPIKVIDQAFALMDSNLHRADELTLPLLMILSKHDRVIDSQQAEQFFNQITSKEKRLVYLSNSGHDMLLDYQWPDVAQEIIDFAQVNTGKPNAQPAVSRADRNQTP